MRFPSPAADHVGKRIDLNAVLMPNPVNGMRLETPEGVMLVDRLVTARPGDTVAFQYDDYPQLGKPFSSGIITQEGETVNGDVLEGKIVLGKFTIIVLQVHSFSSPIRL